MQHACPLYATLVVNTPQLASHKLVHYQQQMMWRVDVHTKTPAEHSVFVVLILELAHVL